MDQAERCNYIVLVLQLLRAAIKWLRCFQFVIRLNHRSIEDSMEQEWGKISWKKPILGRVL